MTTTTSAPSPTLVGPGRFTDMKRGDAKAAIAAAEVKIEGTFTTSAMTHNPLGPFTTMAHWDGDTLTVYDSTQNPFLVRTVLANGVYHATGRRIRSLPVTISQLL
jgi:CO/xanthine dehydrogenase Mo-binding subunit